MATRKDELAKLYRNYNYVINISIGITYIILNDEHIDNKYKNLLHCFDKVELPEIHHGISTSLLWRMGLVENIPPACIDFKKLSYAYTHSEALAKYNLHEDEYVDKYIELQADAILLLDNNAKTLNTIKDYDYIDDAEYHKLVDCIRKLIYNAINTRKILKDIVKYSKKKEER